MGATGATGAAVRWVAGCDRASAPIAPIAPGAPLHPCTRCTRATRRTPQPVREVLRACRAHRGIGIQRQIEGVAQLRAELGLELVEAVRRRLPPCCRLERNGAEGIDVRRRCRRRGTADASAALRRWPTTRRRCRIPLSARHRPIARYRADAGGRDARRDRPHGRWPRRARRRAPATSCTGIGPRSRSTTSSESPTAYSCARYAAP